MTYEQIEEAAHLAAMTVPWCDPYHALLLHWTAMAYMNVRLVV